MAQRSPSPHPAPDRRKVLTKAVIRAARALALNQSRVAATLGVSDPTVSRMFAEKYLLDPARKVWELGALFERNSRTKSAPSSHSFRAGSSRYFSANILETVGSLTPRVAATLDWLSARARAARITALVRTLRRSGAGCGEGLLCAMISLERILLIYF